MVDSLSIRTRFTHCFRTIKLQQPARSKLPILRSFQFRQTQRVALLQTCQLLAQVLCLFHPAYLQVHATLQLAQSRLDWIAATLAHAAKLSVQVTAMPSQPKLAPMFRQPHLEYIPSPPPAAVASFGLGPPTPPPPPPPASSACNLGSQQPRRRPSSHRVSVLCRRRPKTTTVSGTQVLPANTVAVVLAVQLVLQAKQGQSTEQSMNQLLGQNSLESELADYWSLPDQQSLKYFQGRAALLANEAAQGSRGRDDFTACVAYCLELVQRPPNSQNSFDVQQEVLLTFCQAIVTAGFPYKNAFKKPGTAWVHNNKVIWQLDSTAFPGPKLRPKAG